MSSSSLLGHLRNVCFGVEPAGTLSPMDSNMRYGRVRSLYIFLGSGFPTILLYRANVGMQFAEAYLAASLMKAEDGRLSSRWSLSVIYYFFI
jgi:hypothetical protein